MSQNLAVIFVLYTVRTSNSTGSTLQPEYSVEVRSRFAHHPQQGLEVAPDHTIDACRANELGQLGKKIDTLVQILDDIRLNIAKGDPQPLDAKLESLVRELEARKDRITSGGLRDSERVMRNLSLDINCLRWPVPRWVCLLPQHVGTLSDNDRCFSRWSDLLRAWCRDGKKAGRSNISRKLRLFFLCAHDYSLVECGPNGQGYKVKQLREWVAKAMPLAEVALALARITLRICTGLSIPIDEIDAAFGDSLGGVVSEIVKNETTILATRRLESGADGQGLEDMSVVPKVSVRWSELRNVFCQVH